MAEVLAEGKLLLCVTLQRGATLLPCLRMSVFIGVDYRGDGDGHRKMSSSSFRARIVVALIYCLFFCLNVHVHVVGTLCGTYLSPLFVLEERADQRACVLHDSSTVVSD